MPLLAAFPILILLAILQTAIVSQVPLLQGSADLILLVITAWALQERVRTAWQWALIGGLLIGYISALPIWIPLGGYLSAVILALTLRRRIWQIPILAMFVVVLAITLLMHIVTAVFVSLAGAVLNLLDVLNLIMLPSIILNLLLSVPIYAVVKDLAEWLHPEEIEI